MQTRRQFAAYSAGALAALALSGPNRAAFAARPPFHIMMIQWRGDTDVDRGMRTYLGRNQVPAEFLVRDADQDRSKLAAFVAEVKDAKPDLVYVFGTEAALGVVGPMGGDPAKFITDVPVVFAAVGDPVAANIVPRLAGSGRNLTGVIHLPPVQVQFEALNSFFSPTRIGILYNSAETYGSAVVKQLAAITGKLGIETIVETCTNDAGAADEKRIAPALAHISVQRVDLLYLPSTSFFIPLAAPITEAAIELRLPIFSPNEPMIRDGQALAGLVASQFEVGRFAGFKIEQILMHNIAPRDIPIEPLSRFSLLINMAAARKLRIYPPITMLRYAEILHG